MVSLTKIIFIGCVVLLPILFLAWWILGRLEKRNSLESNVNIQSTDFSSLEADFKKHVIDGEFEVIDRIYDRNRDEKKVSVTNTNQSDVLPKELVQKLTHDYNRLLTRVRANSLPSANWEPNAKLSYLENKHGPLPSFIRELIEPRQ